MFFSESGAQPRELAPDLQPVEGPRVVSDSAGDSEPRLVTVEVRHYTVGGGTFIVKSRLERDR